MQFAAAGITAMHCNKFELLHFKQRSLPRVTEEASGGEQEEDALNLTAGAICNLVQLGRQRSLQHI